MLVAYYRDMFGELVHFIFCVLAMIRCGFTLVLGEGCITRFELGDTYGQDVMDSSFFCYM